MHTRRVHLPQEPFRGSLVSRHNAVGVLGSVFVDVCDRLLQGAHHPDGQNVVEILRRPVLLGRRAHRRAEDRPGFLAAPQFHLSTLQARRHGGEKLPRHRLVHQQGFQGVAHSRLLCLGIDHDLLRHGQVRRFIDEHMADPVVVLYHRHARQRDHGLDQPFAPPRNDEVEIAVHGGHLLHALTVREGNELDRTLRQARLLPSGLQGRGNGQVRVNGLLPTPQDGGVA